jgi:hypothetical protein
MEMNAADALDRFAGLCDRLCRLIDATDDKISALERKVRDLEAGQAELMTATDVAKATGWSKSAVAKWVETGFIKSVHVTGKKNPLIPASEVETILNRRGIGKNYGGIR